MRNVLALWCLFVLFFHMIEKRSTPLSPCTPCCQSHPSCNTAQRHPYNRKTLNTSVAVYAMLPIASVHLVRPYGGATGRSNRMLPVSVNIRRRAGASTHTHTHTHTHTQGVFRSLPLYCGLIESPFNCCTGNHTNTPLLWTIYCLLIAILLQWHRACRYIACVLHCRSIAV